MYGRPCYRLLSPNLLPGLRLASPLQSGIDNSAVIFSVAPASIAVGAFVSTPHCSRPQNILVRLGSLSRPMLLVRIVLEWFRLRLALTWDRLCSSPSFNAQDISSVHDDFIFSESPRRLVETENRVQRPVALLSAVRFYIISIRVFPAGGGNCLCRYSEDRY